MVILLTVLLHLSHYVLCYSAGIMAILFCGIVMSHYTHLNLSPVTQITVQQTFRTMAFICGRFLQLLFLCETRESYCTL